MCGIAGYWDFSGQISNESLQDSIYGMTQCLYRRGPDSGGIWIDRRAHLALGHRRLAIRDLSPLGAQPMTTPDGRFTICYNGEIYNVPEIGAELANLGIFPKGSSDTEALLLALAAFGVEKTLDMLIGMFAFALWDRSENKLVLARDRFGVKPLFWTRDQGRRFLFASGTDPFYFADNWQPELDFDSFALYLRFGYIPAPYSIWKNTSSLPQAHFLEVTKDGERLVCYWDALETAQQSLEQPLPDSDNFEAEAVNGLDELLTDTVRRRMVSDVPIGAFLSGGIDSSTIAALMQKCSPTPVRTFSIGFEEEGYDEAPFAEAVARHLQTNHTTLYLPAKKAWEIIPQLPEIYDQPFGDASAVPTTLLSRLTRQHVTTALSGDGGDEFFAGYGRYAACLENAPDFNKAGAVKRCLAGLINTVPITLWDNLAKILPSVVRPHNAGARMRNFADLKLNGSFAAYYQRYSLQHWWHPETIARKGKAPATAGDNENISLALADRLARMQFIDTELYLADDILTKVDRASMSCSLEVRVPMLDHRVFAYAWRIPVAWRQKSCQGKYILRKLLERYVPAKLIDRPKMGFGIPIGQWLTGPLREWAEDLLSEKRLNNDGLFRVLPVRDAWAKHVSGISNWEYNLWIVLMFQAWQYRRKPLIYDESLEVRIY